ncbi:MAG TPA: galactokinase [Ktedonobacteraceae bacterium]|nr:galactokinase [Ktedonobacteraceae bacterium]
MGKDSVLPLPARAALQKFAEVFQGDTAYSSPLGAAWAPGRVNLIGEHTDYNAGYVLPLAVDRVVAFAGHTRADSTIRLWSVYFNEMAEFSLEGLPANFEPARDRLPGWARYVLAVASELRRAGVTLRGFDAVLQGDVPVGGGMSSSAAIEVASVQAFQYFSQGAFQIGSSASGSVTLAPLQVAELCQHAEWAASGVRCGILDQAASCLGRPGQAVLLDCRSLEYRYLPFAAPGISLVVIDSGVRRELATSAYNERRQQCEEATHILRDLIIHDRLDAPGLREILALRDISPEEFARYQNDLPEILRRRASYIIAENLRVLETVKRLENDDLVGVGELLWQTHAGLRDEYEVSSFELDTLVDLARSVPGVLGARMMGAGFGGCTVNLVRDEAVEALRQIVEEQYQARTGLQASIDTCRAAGGPGSALNLND